MVRLDTVNIEDAGSKPARTALRHCKHHGDTEFFYDKEGPGRYRCKRCRAERVIKRRAKLKQMALEYKGGVCSLCGYSKCKDALEFHHRDRLTKSFGISSKGYTRSWERVRNELDKCILLCANCHREVAAGIKKYKIAR